MKELSDAAISLLDDMLGEWSDHDRHHPDESTDEEREAFGQVWECVTAEAKRRGFWWAK